LGWKLACRERCGFQGFQEADLGLRTDNSENRYRRPDRHWVLQTYVLDEERATDVALTKLAKSVINLDAEVDEAA
jgi:hypothetical protein